MILRSEKTYSELFDSLGFTTIYTGVFTDYECEVESKTIAFVMSCQPTLPEHPNIVTPLNPMNNNMLNILEEKSSEIDKVAETGGTQDNKPVAPGNYQAALDNKMKNF